MAKQRGLHQIKGKVGEFSYYSQTGVSGGLIRKINEGLSARVKSDAAYANTRLNNQEFGSAANTAALLGQCVTPKFRPMILPFSQSKMAKEVLKVAREKTANWGQRVVTSADTERLCEILTSMSKLNIDDFVSVSVSRADASTANVGSAYTADQSAMMAGLGINYLEVRAVQIDIATGEWNPLAGEMSIGYLYRKDSAEPFSGVNIVAGESDDSDSDINVAEFIPEANHYGHQIVVFVSLPARKVNNVVHILQEYCSFKAMPLPANA